MMMNEPAELMISVNTKLSTSVRNGSSVADGSGIIQLLEYHTQPAPFRTVTTELWPEMQQNPPTNKSQHKSIQKIWLCFLYY